MIIRLGNKGIVEKLQAFFAGIKNTVNRIFLTNPFLHRFWLGKVMKIS